MTGADPGAPAFIFAEEIPSAVGRDECAELCRIAAGKRVLELGAHYGRSTVALASVAEIVVSVDHHRGDIGAVGDSLHVYFDNLERRGVRERVLALVGPFEGVLPLLRPRIFDLLFLDGSHDYEAVRRDIVLALPLLTPRAALAFHDYGPDYFGVKRAVDEFVAKWRRFGGPTERVVGTLYVVEGI